MSRIYEKNYYFYYGEEQVFMYTPLWKNYSRINHFNLAYFLTNTDSFNTKESSFSFLTLTPLSTTSFNSLMSMQQCLPSVASNFLAKSKIFDSFLYLRYSFFISFFLNNMLDVPVCFRKSRSLIRKNNQLPLLKFSNLLMRQGKREQIIKKLIVTLNNFFLTLQKENFFSIDLMQDWFDFYFYLNNTIFSKNVQKLYRFQYVNFLKFKCFLNSSDKILSESFFLKNYLFSRLTQVVPIFNFFVYNVDKNIRKFSRGKSGKYVFVWKYIAPYKRSFSAMRWIMRDIKFNSGVTINDRIEGILNRLTKEPNLSFAWRAHTFAHSYTYKNYKKTLMSNLKTLS